MLSGRFPVLDIRLRLSQHPHIVYPEFLELGEGT